MANLPPSPFSSVDTGVSAETLVVASVSQAPAAAASSHLSHSGVPFAPAPDDAAALASSRSPDAAADIPDDLKQRFLAAIEADYRVHVVDLEKLEAALYAPPDIRGESFEEYIAKLRELADNDEPPLFIQQQKRA